LEITKLKSSVTIQVSYPRRRVSIFLSRMDFAESAERIRGYSVKLCWTEDEVRGEFDFVTHGLGIVSVTACS